MNSHRNNSNILKKIEIRENVSNIENKRVLDVCCGNTGEMFRNLWNKASVYLGFDLDPHRLSRTIKGNNSDLIRSIDIDGYNVFDIDVYSNPYPLLDYVLRHKSGVYEVIITDGMLRGYDSSVFIKKHIGFNHGLLRKFQIEVIKKIINGLLKKNSSILLDGKYIRISKNALSKMVYIYMKIKSS